MHFKMGEDGVGRCIFCLEMNVDRRYHNEWVQETDNSIWARVYKTVIGTKFKVTSKNCSDI